MQHTNPSRGLGCAVLIGLLLVWQAVSTLGWVRPIFLSSPIAVLRAPFGMNLNELAGAFLVSARAYALAMILSTVAGLPIGIALGLHARLFAAVRPLIAILQATPRIAFAPLLILWLGIGASSVVALIFLNAVVPIIVITMTGVKNTDQRWLDCAQAFGASPLMRVTCVFLPASVPYVLAALRLAAGRGLVSMVVAEIVASTGGLGYLIRIFASGFQTDRMFVGIALVTLSGLLLDTLFAALERKFLTWKNI